MCGKIGIFSVSGHVFGMDGVDVTVRGNKQTRSGREGDEKKQTRKSSDREGNW